MHLIKTKENSFFVHVFLGGKRASELLNGYPVLNHQDVEILQIASVSETLMIVELIYKD